MVTWFPPRRPDNTIWALKQAAKFAGLFVAAAVIWTGVPPL